MIGHQFNNDISAGKKPNRSTVPAVHGKVEPGEEEERGDAGGGERVHRLVHNQEPDSPQYWMLYTEVSRGFQL
jgi:hypothetical protein